MRCSDVKATAALWLKGKAEGHPPKKQAQAHEAKDPELHESKYKGSETMVVGAIRVASKPGGLNIKECLQPRITPPYRSRSTDNCGKPSQCRGGEGRSLLGRNGYEHQGNHRGTGPSIQGKIRGDNAGNHPLPAKGLAATCEDLLYKENEVSKRYCGGAHELVRAMKAE